MKALGIIPARYGSTRFPGKPLIDIEGMSMIQRVYTQAQKSKLLSDVIVATDDDRIVDHVLSFGGKVVLTDSSHNNGTSRCGEVVKKNSDFDLIINIQGDEPLINPLQIDAVLSAFKNDEVQIATVVKAISDPEELENENRIKVVLDHQKNALYFSRSAIPFVVGQSRAHWHQGMRCYKHIGIYAWRQSTLLELLDLPVTELEIAESLEQLRWLYYGYTIATVESDLDTPNIDTPADLKAVIRALNENR